jgi:hypothetical protein
MNKCEYIPIYHSTAFNGISIESRVQQNVFRKLEICSYQNSLIDELSLKVQYVLDLYLSPTINSHHNSGCFLILHSRDIFVGGFSPFRPNFTIRSPQHSNTYPANFITTWGSLEIAQPICAARFVFGQFERLKAAALSGGHITNIAWW